MLAIDYAVGKSGSTDAEKMRAVLASGDIPTTRGPLQMNSNNFPVQNFYLREAVKDADGVVTTKIIETVFENHGDAYAKDCSF
jgi:branched-chain amino acid transport system substrate-binding protein